MKLNRMMTLCAMTAALALGAGNILAQDNGGGPGGPGGGFGGPGGGGPGGGFGGGNFDPAQMMQQIQQFMMQNYQQQLGITNDTDWTAIQPLIQKVMDAQQALTADSGAGGFGGFGGGRGGRGGPGGGGGFGGFGGQTPSPEMQALQTAIDNDAPAAQIKDALSKFEAAKKIKQDALTAAQEALRQVLSGKQEAEATLIGLLP